MVWVRLDQEVHHSQALVTKVMNLRLSKRL
jgi:hypothetical protein